VNIRWPEVVLEHTLANSYRDFHAKGFDYLCIRRSPSETIKLYFFDGGGVDAPEVVVPHDHRYDFDTWVVAGASENAWYREVAKDDPRGQRFNEFAYRTPLNGGDGFTFVRTASLVEFARKTYRPSPRGVGPYGYTMASHDIHTIRILEPGTVLGLIQREDVRPLGVPSNSYFREAPPKTWDDGLYRRWTADEVLARLRWLEERVGLRLEVGGAS